MRSRLRIPGRRRAAPRGGSQTPLERALRDALPDVDVKTDELYRGVYGRDASFYDYRPQAVVRPSTVEEVQRLFAVAREQRVPVTFRAAGTSLCGQTLGTGVVAELRLAWKGVEVRDGGAAVWFEPGVTVAHLNHLLEPWGRKLGPDPESANAAMMGGVLANNSGGQQSGIEADPYGTLRGMEFVLVNGHRYDTTRPTTGGGSTSRSGRSPRAWPPCATACAPTRELVERIRRKYRIKNVMGYGLRAFLDADEPIDILARLLVGSEGTLGFIASATLATVPLHPHWAVGLLFFATVTEAVAGVRALVEHGAATVELMDRACLRAWSGKAGVPPYVDELPADATAVLVEYRAATAAAARRAGRVGLRARRGLRPRRPRDPDVGAREARAVVRAALGHVSRWWRRPDRRGPACVIEDVAVPPDRLTELILGLRGLFARYGYADTGFIFGHLASGNVHFMALDDLRDARGRRALRPLHRRPGRPRARPRRVAEGRARHRSRHGALPHPRVGRGRGRRHARGQAPSRPSRPPQPRRAAQRRPGVHVAHVKRTPSVGDDTVDRCVECGFCERVCPSRALTLTPRQRIAAKRVGLEFEEAGEPDSAAAVWGEFAYDGRDTCVADGLCGTVCPAGINIAYLTDHERAAGSRGRARAAHGPRRATLRPRGGSPAARHRRRLWPRRASRCRRRGLGDGGGPPPDPRPAAVVALDHQGRRRA